MLPLHVPGKISLHVDQTGGGVGGGPAGHRGEQNSVAWWTPYPRKATWHHVKLKKATGVIQGSTTGYNEPYHQHCRCSIAKVIYPVHRSHGCRYVSSKPSKTLRSACSMVSARASFPSLPFQL